MPEIKKQKLIVPPYQLDRKSKQFELIAPKGNCPYCRTSLSNFEAEDGSIHLWCFNCRNHFADNAPVV